MTVENKGGFRTICNFDRFAARDNISCSKPAEVR
jgi:hypothetical protein